jgi:hypothetical protein
MNTGFSSIFVKPINIELVFLLLLWSSQELLKCEWRIANDFQTALAIFKLLYTNRVLNTWTILLNYNFRSWPKLSRTRECVGDWLYKLHNLTIKHLKLSIPRMSIIVSNTDSSSLWFKQC